MHIHISDKNIQTQNFIATEIRFGFLTNIRSQNTTKKWILCARCLCLRIDLIHIYTDIAIYEQVLKNTVSNIKLNIRVLKHI